MVCNGVLVRVRVSVQERFYVIIVFYSTQVITYQKQPKSHSIRYNSIMCVCMHHTIPQVHNTNT